MSAPVGAVIRPPAAADLGGVIGWVATAHRVPVRVPSPTEPVAPRGQETETIGAWAGTRATTAAAECAPAGHHRWHLSGSGPGLPNRSQARSKHSFIDKACWLGRGLGPAILRALAAALTAGLAGPAKGATPPLRRAG